MQWLHKQSHRNARYCLWLSATIPLSNSNSVKFRFCGVENLSESSTALQQKATRLLLKDAFDRDSVPTGRSFDRITSIVKELRREDAAAAAGSVPRSSSVRDELDSFAILVSKLSRGSAAGISRRQTSAGSDPEDFWTRLAHTHSDLSQLETLVGRTFGSSHRATVSNSPPPSVTVEPVFIINIIIIMEIVHKVQ